MGSRKSALREERGVTLVLMALMLFLAMGMSALAIDYGMIKSAKAEGQRAMDAAALAGASAFLISDPDADIRAIAEARAREFAKKHDVHRTAITDPEVTVVVDTSKNMVTASYISPGIPLWFASIFGTKTMAIRALAAAHAEETGFSSCLKPVGIPDMWDNSKTMSKEDAKPYGNNDKMWDSKDGTWNAGTVEPWKFDPGIDSYQPASTGYGTSVRDGLGGLTKDYGRQLPLTTFDPADNTVASMYYSWGNTTNDNQADLIAARIRDNDCQLATVNTTYAAANGAKLGQIANAWDDVIARDKDAYWDSNTETVHPSTTYPNWLDNSPRVIVVGLYDPTKHGLKSQDNQIEFVNLAKIWLEKRAACGGKGNGNCKPPLTGRFLGYVGGGASGPKTGSLVKRLVLIK